MENDWLFSVFIEDIRCNVGKSILQCCIVEFQNQIYMIIDISYTITIYIIYVCNELLH